MADDTDDDGTDDSADDCPVAAGNSTLDRTGVPTGMVMEPAI